MVTTHMVGRRFLAVQLYHQPEKSGDLLYVCLRPLMPAQLIHSRGMRVVAMVSWVPFFFKLAHTAGSSLSKMRVRIPAASHDRDAPIPSVLPAHVLECLPPMPLSMSNSSAFWTTTLSKGRLVGFVGVCFHWCVLSLVHPLQQMYVGRVDLFCVQAPPHLQLCLTEPNAFWKSTVAIHSPSLHSFLFCRI